MKNIARLVRTIKQCGYEVQFRKVRLLPYPVDGSFDHSTGCITIEFDKRASARMILIILSHEMGHMWADMHKSGRMIGSLEDETIAWDGAVELLQEVGFNDWKVFNRLRGLCLMSYGVNGRNRRWRLPR